MFEEDYLKNGWTKSVGVTTPVEIVQLDISGKIISKYKSIREAARAAGIGSFRLARYIKGKIKFKDSMWMSEIDYLTKIDVAQQG